MKEDSRFDLTNIVTITKSMIEELPYFQADEDCLIANLTEGGEHPLVLITGENATGKSFLRRLYYVLFKEYRGIECIHLSQQGRSTGGVMRAFVYGDESWESTGYISAGTIEGGVRTCNDREKEHAIIWDEPDIGLSDSYAAGVGVEIRKFVENLPKLTFGVVIITHSKHLIKQLLPLKPHHLRLGDNKSLESFLNERVKPKDIKKLRDSGIETFRKISAILKRKEE